MVTFKQLEKLIIEVIMQHSYYPSVSIPSRLTNDPNFGWLWKTSNFFRKSSSQVQSKILQLGLIWPENADEVEVHRCACLGDIETLKTAVQRDPSVVKLLDNRQNTPLNLAASAGQLEVVKYLVKEAKADPNSRDDHGCTPLLWAARYNRIAVMRVLIAGGANVNAIDNYGCTALAWALKMGKTEAARFLLTEAKAEPKKDSYGNSLLFNAIIGGFVSACKMLLEEFKVPIKGDVDKHGRNCLHLAIWKRKTHVIEMLLREYNVKELILTPNTRTGETPYHMALKLLGTEITNNLFAGYLSQEDLTKLKLLEEKASNSASKPLYGNRQLVKQRVADDYSQMEYPVQNYSKEEKDTKPLPTNGVQYNAFQQPQYGAQSLQSQHSTQPMQRYSNVGTKTYNQGQSFAFGYPVRPRLMMQYPMGPMMSGSNISTVSLGAPYYQGGYSYSISNGYTLNYTGVMFIPQGQPFVPVLNYTQPAQANNGVVYPPQLPQQQYHTQGNRYLSFVAASSSLETNGNSVQAPLPSQPLPLPNKSTQVSSAVFQLRQN